MRSRGTESVVSDVSASSSDRSHAGATMTPKAERVRGTCNCGKSGRRLKGGESACECKQVKVNSNVYNKEVYAALNTRGGAIWERLRKESAAEQHASFTLG